MSSQKEKVAPISAAQEEAIKGALTCHPKEADTASDKTLKRGRYKDDSRHESIDASLAHLFGKDISLAFYPSGDLGSHIHWYRI